MKNNIAFIINIVVIFVALLSVFNHVTVSHAAAGSGSGNSDAAIVGIVTGWLQKFLNHRVFLSGVLVRGS